MDSHSSEFHYFSKESVAAGLQMDHSRLPMIHDGSSTAPEAAAFVRKTPRAASQMEVVQETWEPSSP